MASALRPFPSPALLQLSRKKRCSITILACSSSPTPEPSDMPDIPPLPTPISTDSTGIEKRRPSTIFRDPLRPPAKLPEPPNFQIGWKRTKKIETEKPKGWVIADFLEKLETLMGREFGSTELLAKVGYIAAERAREEAEILKAGGEVEDRMVTELHRVLRLMEMDLEMVKASVKEETLAERLDQAKARCRQAILVALSF
ncbi:hypothetical protein J5N97_027233 [Dioscorea zingiberensis]|uniref:Chlororespiratory reduction 41 n=1 Tax=Dioscorea zingiberensis TaxID=325984 RepID=A0A9D5C3T9_9LILI|nr:hypothetical protein J5N97_027233 [Dioscorea zingiberensis]